MTRKKIFPLVAFLLCLMPFLTQAVHAEPPKRIPSDKSSSTTSITPQPTTIAGGINVQSTRQCPKYFLDAGEVKGQTRCEEDIVFRSNIMKISGSEQNHPKLYLKFLTITQADVTFENLDIEGNIKVTGESKITFKNCTINGMPNNECGIEIFAKSSGVFENSILQGDSKTCVAVRDESRATFSDCTISNSKGSGILILNKSENIKVTQCKFLNCQRYAVFLCKSSSADINECEFQDPKRFNGRAILALDGCQATVSKSKFIGCKSVAITCANSSNMNVKECNFNDLENSAVYGLKSSLIFVSDCNFKNIKGNGVHYECSGGMTQNCRFDAIDLPAIAILEMDSDLKISNCVISGDRSSFYIAIRNGAKPILEDITFKEFTSKHPLISCSDFAEPTITNLKFEGSNELPRIMVYNGAVIKDEHMSNRNTIFLNYNEETQYHSMFDNENFTKQFNPSKDIVVEKKTEGEFRISGDTDSKFRIFSNVDVNTCKGFTIPPAMLSPKSENANANETKINEKFVYSNCAHTAHTATICPYCENMCKIDIVGDQVRKVCDICNSAFLRATYFCPLCEIPNQKLLKVFERDECVICCTNSATCIALPCGHKNVCDECSHICIKDKKECPECRSKILSFKHDFFNNYK